MTAGYVWIAGSRLSVSAVTARVFTASKDTYVDFKDNGDGTASINYTEATNNAASPALFSSGTTANTIRGAIIVTGASNIAAVGSINMGEADRILPIASSTAYSVSDSLGNLICPRDPNRKVLGYRQITAAVTLTAPTVATLLTGLSLPFIIPTGRKAKITFDGGLSIQNSGANVSSAGLCLTSASDGNRIKQGNIAAAVSGGIPYFCEYVTPSTVTGTPTYVAFLRAASGNVTSNADPLSPAFIKAELI